MQDNYNRECVWISGLGVFVAVSYGLKMEPVLTILPLGEKTKQNNAALQPGLQSKVNSLLYLVQPKHKKVKSLSNLF